MCRAPLRAPFVHLVVAALWRQCKLQASLTQGCTLRVVVQTIQGGIAPQDCQLSRCMLSFSRRGHGLLTSAELQSVVSAMPATSRARQARLHSGNIRDEPGAVVCRVSGSFIRFGTFQLPASREEFHNIPRLADYVIRHHYPQFEGALLDAVAIHSCAASPRHPACLHGFGSLLSHGFAQRPTSHRDTAECSIYQGS